VTTQQPSPLLAWLYRLAAVLVLFTGFCNMPIAKRYYISDLPGLGWSGDFFLNVQVHYLLGPCCWPWPSILAWGAAWPVVITLDP